MMLCVLQCRHRHGGQDEFTYYKYSVYLAIIAVCAGGAAERAGLKVGPSSPR